MNNFNMGISPDDRIGELARQKANRAAALESLRMSRVTSTERTKMSALLESQDAEANASIDRKDKLNSIAEKKRCESAKRESLMLESKLVKEGTEICFETAIFSMTYNALPYPDDVKESLDVLEMSELVFAMYESVLKTCKEANKGCKGKDSKLVENIKLACEATAKKAAKRLTKCTEEDPMMKKIDFTLTDEEADELDINIKDLGVEQIEELIKQKVVKVVEDEQKAGEQKAKTLDEINSAIDQAKEPAGDAGLTESAEVRLLNRKLKTIESSFGNTIFESLFMSSLNSIGHSAVIEGIEASEVDKGDVAFLESVIKYTTLETINTLGLIDFKRDNVAREINRSILKDIK